MFTRRKCIRVKILGLLFLVIAFITLLEHWRGGKNTVHASSTSDEVFEQEIREDEARIVPGLGEGGDAAHLLGLDAEMGQLSEAKNAINVYLSDRIPYNRTLNDYRHPACTRMIYDAELPSVSVVIIFHNEPYSVLLRTVWSVLNTCKRRRSWFKSANFIESNGNIMTLGYPGQPKDSEYVYLKEIILVDDNSTLPELKGKLNYYVRTRMSNIVRILRLPERVGKIEAQSVAAHFARGEILVFIDPSFECISDWLRPMLQRIKGHRNAVTVPVIDRVDPSTFTFLDSPLNTEFEVGGFNFAGDFIWIPVSDYEKKRRGSDVAPTWSPTMAGGLFAIDRSYFWELGGYDEQMQGWGGENLELSFRIWMCGGTLETIPCSRVGHIFRKFHPYGLPAETDTFGINTARTAEVWMDSYKELFYLYRPDLRQNPAVGDVVHRQILREKLKCKTFQWYLDNIYRDKFIPIRDVINWGRIRAPSSGLCVDTFGRGETERAGAYSCHARLEATQLWSYTKRQAVRNEDYCLEVPDYRDNKRIVVLMPCGRGETHNRQKWWYMDGHLRHAESGLCLTAGGELAVSVCDAANDAQIWRFDVGEDQKIDDRLFQSADQIFALEKIRGKRRLSRSLISNDYEMEEDNTLDGRRRFGHTNKNFTSHDRANSRRVSNSTGVDKKRNKNKDKFLLTLVRGKPDSNDTEHLEVVVSCKHKQLKPNNGFVRDIVTVLNTRGISVVNNGRIFKDNIATKLPKDVDPYTLQKINKKAFFLKSGKGNYKKASPKPSISRVQHKKPSHVFQKKTLVREHERRPAASGEPAAWPRARTDYQEEEDQAPSDGLNAEPKEPTRRQYSSEEAACSSTPPPVEFLLKSNLTFVLGDEFFNWKKSKESKSVTEPPPESLAIPAASAVPVRARRGRPPFASPTQDRGGDRGNPSGGTDEDQRIYGKEDSGASGEEYYSGGYANTQTNSS